MAGVFKRGSTFYCRVCTDGKEVIRSLKTGDRTVAIRKAREVVARLKGRQWVGPALRDLVDRAGRETPPDEMPLLLEAVAGANCTLLNLVPEKERDTAATTMARRILARQQRKLAIRDAWEAWLNTSNRSQPKERTIAGYRAATQRFVKWAAGEKIEFLHELDAVNAQRYANNLWVSRVTPATFNLHLKFLRSLWRVLTATAGLSTFPWMEIRLRKLEKNRGERALTDEEQRLVIAAAEWCRWTSHQMAN